MTSNVALEGTLRRASSSRRTLGAGRLPALRHWAASASTARHRGPSQTVPRQHCTVSEVTISMIVVGTGHAARRPSASAAADTNVVLGRALYEEMMYTAYRIIEYYHHATHMPPGTSPGDRCVSRQRDGRGTACRLNQVSPGCI